jgi:riboflavin transporter FmnP
MSDTKVVDEIESFFSKKISFTIQIVGGAIFGALSLVFSLYVVPYLPRTPQGFAYFDPVSIIWVTCFLIFGPLAGILCSVIGMLVLFPFDPFTPIGPIMKFSATFSLIIVPILLLYLFRRKKGMRMSQKLKEPKTYILYGALGLVLRIIVMVILNIIVYLSFYGSEGLEFWIFMVILLNSLTTLWDLLIPYLLVFTTNLDEKFEIW